MASVSDILHKAPHRPGVYLMKNTRGKVFYVGKAKDLHKRMHQYINPGSDTRTFVQILDRILASAEFFITASEKEALILENVLIKKHQPRYNVLIKDDKTYFSLRLDLKPDYPRLDVVRGRKRKQVIHYGPYSSAKKARAMLRLVNKHFMLRDCSDQIFAKATRPCVRHQMGRCHAPCSLEVSRETYHEEVKRVRLFLEGRKELLLAELEPMMKEAAGVLDFERAARIRDQISAVNGSLEKQVVDLSRDEDWDVIGWKREGETATFALIRLRDGVIRGREAFDVTCRALPDSAVISGFVSRYYEEAWPLPKRVLLPSLPEDALTLSQWLSEKRGSKVEVVVAERGAPARLASIAGANADQEFFERHSGQAERKRTLEKLKRILSLKKTPRRIECVDISNFQGSLAVGSMVCFIDGEMAKNEYRRYRIQSMESPDDFGMMREVLSRRFHRGLQEDNLPDLLVVDGGKGQLNVARAIFKELGVASVSVVSLAKSRLKDQVGAGELADEFEGKLRTPERVYLPQVKNPVLLKPGTAELSLLQRLRDEAHRVAITYYRKLHSKRNLRSGLLEIPGIGPKRARLLLRSFGSLKRVRDAEIAEIAKLEGFNTKLAEAVKTYLG